MAYPGDPSDPAAKGQGGGLATRLTADDFERLAAAFRPSWELDDAALTQPGAASSAAVRVMPGGGAAFTPAPVANGMHAPAKRVASHEPDESVIIDRSVTAADIASGTPAGPGKTAGAALRANGPPVVT